MLLFLSMAGLFVIVIGTLFFRHYRNTQRRTTAQWSDLLGRLVPLNKVGIEIITGDLLDANGIERSDAEAKSLSPEEIWRMIDGMDGLARLRHNSEVLLDIAAYALEWHPDAFDTAERLRLQAREIAWLVDSLRAAEENGSLESWFANYAQRAVASYFVMIQSLLPMLAYAQHGAVADFQNAL